MGRMSAVRGRLAGRSVRTLVAAFVMSAVVLGTAGAAGAAMVAPARWCYLGANKIVFSSNRSGDYELYSINQDGTGLARLTYSAGYDLEPSQAGTGRIAFRSNRTGYKQIFVMNSDGSGQQQLTFDTGVNKQPSFSPDGTKIAFTSYRTGRAEVFVMNADGTGVTQLSGLAYTASSGTSNEDSAWSPDGTKVAMVRTVGGYTDIYWIRLSDRADSRVTYDGAVYDPTWSPDSKEIAFTFRPHQADQAIHYVDANSVNVEFQVSTRLGTDQNPSWSPDGSTIVFAESLSTGWRLQTSKGALVTASPSVNFEPNWGVPRYICQAG